MCLWMDLSERKLYLIIDHYSRRDCIIDQFWVHWHFWVHEAISLNVCLWNSLSIPPTLVSAQPGTSSLCSASTHTHTHTHKQQTLPKLTFSHKHHLTVSSTSGEYSPNWILSSCYLSFSASFFSLSLPPFFIFHKYVTSEKGERESLDQIIAGWLTFPTM